MRGRGRRVALAVVVAALTWVVVLPGRPAAADTATTFTVGITQDIDSLNPFTGIASAAYEIYQLQYETLTDYAQKDYAAVPGLAESWDTSADGLTWTYHLRAGLTWSDGVPLTANDVAYTFNRVLSGKYEQTNYNTYVSALTSVVATDDQTVVMKVKTPTPVMLHLYLYILPEHIWKTIDEKKVKSFGNEPGPDGLVGSGPFLVTEHKKGQFVRLKANDSYWRGKPHIENLVFRVFQNEDSLAQALRRGEIDFADNLGSNVFNSLKDAPGVTSVSATYSGFNEIAFNTGAALDDGTPIGDGHPALKDPKLRQALSYAVDTKALVDRVLGGHGTPGTSVVPSIYQGLHYDPGPSAYTFDPAKAASLLDAAGYTRGPDGIRRTPGDGKPLAFRLFGRSSSQTSQQSVQFVAGWLSDVGIKVKTKIVSEDALTELIGQGKFDLFEWGWVVEPDPNYQLSTFTCASRSYRDGGSIFANLSDSFFCDKGYDALYARQAREIDPAARTATVQKMQQILYEQAPYIVTYYYDNLEAYRSDRFTGLLPQPDPHGALLFQYGTASYRGVRAVTAADSSPRASGGSGVGGKAGAVADAGSSGAGAGAGVVAGVVVAVAVVLGAGGLLLLFARRRRSEHDVE